MFYAQIDENNVCQAVTQFSEEATSPNLIPIPDYRIDLLGATYNPQTGQFTPPEVLVREDKRITKRAFQNRFPKTENGVTTKYDRMSLFLSDDGYAASLGVSGAALYSVREYIVTGKNRLDSSQHVDYGSTEAAEFLTLLMQTFVPPAFRLLEAERNKMLTDPILESERYKS